MLPKPIYESLPYLNLAVGIAIICSYQTLLTACSGVLFFAAGALMWILRSDHRRKDRDHNYLFSEGCQREIYELKPFFYIIFGLLSTNWLDNALIDAAGVAVAAFGLFVLLKRSIYRHCVVAE